jgi:WD40 repeat protein/serine/threonine protein kinase/class 3 adenylate cyclase
MVDQEANDHKDPESKPQDIEKLFKDPEGLPPSIGEFETDLTIFFTDLKGSTEYFDRKGDVDGLLRIEKHNQLLFPVIQEEGGRIIKTIGDSIMALFENPMAGVRAAERMQRLLFNYNQDKSDREQIHISIGLNTGKGFIKEKDVFGKVVNIAARIESMTGPDEILISESTHRSIQAGQRFRSLFLKKARLKGIEKKIGIYKVFFREREEVLPFDILLRRFENAKSQKDRHRNAMFLMDTVIRLFAIVALKYFIKERDKDPAAIKSIRGLAFPSTSTFTGILRDTFDFFEKNQSDGATELSSLKNFIFSPLDGFNRALELFTTLSNYLSLKKSGSSTSKIIDLFDLFPAYKRLVNDKELSMEGIYLQHGSLLIHCCAEMLERCDFFDEHKLVLLEEVSASEGGLRLTFRELKGEVLSFITERVSKETGFQRGKIYLKLSEGTFLPLYPCLIHMEDEMGENIFFLDRDERKKSIRYLSFSSGKWTSDPQDLMAFRGLLAEVVDHRVDEKEHAELIEEVIKQEKEYLPSLVTGKLLGDFEILEKIGEGGMGAVFKAKQLSLGRTVAVKMLPMELSKNSLLKARFRREITVLGKCDHPNIVKVIASGEEEGNLYYAMEYVEGASLADVFNELSMNEAKESLSELALSQSISSLVKKNRKEGGGPVKKEETASPPSSDEDYYKKIAWYGIHAARALEYIHKRNIIHRDVKPSNFMVTEDGERLVLMDFGLARYEGAQTLTTTSIEKMMGTIRYASPQQISGVRQKIDHRTDIYSLAATLYELVSITPVYDSDSQPALINKVLVGEPFPLKKLNPEIPDDIATIIHKGLEKDPENRYATAGDIAEDLERFINGDPILATSPSTWMQIKNLIKKHKGPFAAVLTISLLTLFGGMISLVFWQKAEMALKEREIALNIKKVALKDKKKALKISTRNLSLAWAEKGKLFHEKRYYQLAYLAAAKAIAMNREVGSSEAFTTLLLSKNKSFLRFIEAMALNNSSEILSLAFSPGGKIFASGGVDRTIRLWDVKTFREISTLKGHKGPIMTIAFDPNGKILVSGSKDDATGVERTLKFWDVGTGREYVTSKEHKDLVNAFAFSPDGKTIATGGLGTIVLRDIITNEELFTLKGHGIWVHSLAFSPDGKLLASGSEDRAVKLWDVERGSELATLKGHEGTVSSLAFSRDGEILASGGHEDIIFWEVKSGRMLTKIRGHESAISSIFFSHDGKTMITGGLDKIIKTWEITTERKRDRLTEHRGDVSSVVFSPAGKILASGSSDDTVRLWDMKTRKEIISFKGQTGMITLAFSPDGKILASGSEDTTIKLWDVERGKELATLKGHGGIVLSVSFSPDGKILASGSEDKTIRLWDVERGEEIGLLRGHVWINTVAFSPDGRILASGSADKTIRLWDIKNNKELNRLKGHQNGVWSVTFSPDGKLLASGSEDRTVKIWEVETGRELASLKGHQSWVKSVAFSQDGEILASGGGDDTIRLWDLKNKREFAALRGHQEWVWSVAFSPDGKTLASGSADNTIRLWDVSFILKSPTEILREAEKDTGLTTAGFSIIPKEVKSPSEERGIPLKN